MVVGGDIMKNILVVGSLNMDMIITVERIPNLGETLSGRDFMTVPGGKGANQALAVARLGGNVKMLGCVGNDSFGMEMTEYLKNSGVDVSSIKKADRNTGIAFITVCNGDNMIVLEKGANYMLKLEDIVANRTLFIWADMVVLQLEILWDTVVEAARVAKEENCTVLLNPAPVENFNKEILKYVDIMVPNEHEAGVIFGKTVATVEDAKNFVTEFAKQGMKLVVTLGSNGCVYYDNGMVKHCPAIPTIVVDTTAAGDSFIGAMCVAMCENKSFDEAIQFATKVASIVVSRKGAGISIPTRDEVE